jgi:hypothetical protein
MIVLLGYFFFTIQLNKLIIGDSFKGCVIIFIIISNLYMYFFFIKHAASPHRIQNIFFN